MISIMDFSYLVDFCLESVAGINEIKIKCHFQWIFVVVECEGELVY